MSSLRLLLVSAAALSLCAEEQPVPPVPEATEAAPTVSEDPLPDPIPTPSTTSQGLMGLAARRIMAPRQDAQRPVSGRLRLGAGYDSNGLLLDDADSVVTELAGPYAAAALSVTWHAIRTEIHRLNVAAMVDYDHYTDQDEARQFRYGGLLTYAAKLGSSLPAGTLGAWRYRIDGEEVALAIGGTANWSMPTTHWVALATLEATSLDYDEVEIASGTLLALGYRHWFLLRPADPRRRLEAGLRIGTFTAEEDFESYLIVRPSFDAHWRLGTGQSTGTWDLAGHLFYEYRAYEEAVPLVADEEIDHTLRLQIEADRWFNSWLSGGLFAAGSNRTSNILSREYDRFQVGLRLTAAY